ncbi:MAG: hypothetical protein V1846_04930 [Candidatus Komeilibacteria bacterium]
MTKTLIQVSRYSLLTLLLVVGFLVSAHVARAANGDVAVASTLSEASAAVGTAQIQIKCAGGDYTALATTAAGGTLAATTPAGGSNCDVDEEQMDYKVIKDGYVTKTVTAVAGGWRSGSLNTITITGVQYAYKVTAISTETIGTDITATATEVKVGDGTGQNTCVLSSGAWYCAVVAANSDAAPTVSVTLDGYVTKTDYAFATGGGTRTDATAAQNTGTVTSVQYAYKLTSIKTEALATEKRASVTSVKVGDSTGLTTCTLNSTTWYCPTVLANSNGTLVAEIALDGYVTTNYSLVTGTTRTASDSSQVSDTVTSLQYALKVTAYDGATGTTPLESATVEAGDSLATVCSESTGVYYCAIPLANTATYARVIKDGYGTQSLNYTDRTAATDAQGALTFHMTTATGSAGNGGSSSGSSGSSTPPVIPPTTPIPPVIPPVTTPIGAPDSFIPNPTSVKTNLYYDPSDPVTLLQVMGETANPTEVAKNEKLVKSDGKQFGVILSATEATDAANFVTYGISDATKDLGSGERRAVLRDYLETTKFSDIKWDDVARLADGAKPVNRNLKLEQSKVPAALKTFVRIFGHNPNFQNATEDVAWNTIMYRIRFTRDLAKEASGITKFKSIFKTTPSTPADWAAVRILGYVKI